MNDQGKFSRPKSVTFTLDTTAPTVNFVDIGAGPFRGGSSISLSYNASDLNGIGSSSLLFAADGSNFTSVASNPSSIYSWTVPV